MAFDTPASDASLAKASKGLSERNVTVYTVDTRADALAKIRELIPHGAEVMTGASVTLEEIGFVDLLKSGTHPWRNLKDAIVGETDPAKQAQLRKQATLSQYFLGSVHAVTEAGELMIASNSGSQIPSYAFSSDHVIWVVGAQKVVKDLDAAFTRVREYVVPLEDEHMKSLGVASGTNLSKMLIFFKEILPTRKLVLVFVKEKSGF